MIANCPHCGYRINPFTGKCQNKMCQPRESKPIDEAQVRRAAELQAENKRKSDETMRELWAESIANGCRIEDVPAEFRPLSPVVAHLKTVTNKGLWGGLAR